MLSKTIRLSTSMWTGIGRKKVTFFFKNSAFRDPALSNGTAVKKMNNQGKLSSGLDSQAELNCLLRAPHPERHMGKNCSSPGQPSWTSNQKRYTRSHTERARILSWENCLEFLIMVSLNLCLVHGAWLRALAHVWSQLLTPPYQGQ